MSFDVVSQFKAQGIDTSVLKQVSQEIMKRAGGAQNSEFNVNAAFKDTTRSPQELGLNLYDGKIGVEMQKQIALNNSGLQIQLNQNVLNSIRYLNTQAAQQNANNLNGRLNIDVNDVTPKVIAPENPTLTQGILSFATDKDKSGSQTPYRGELLNFQKNDDDNNKNKVENIFNKVF